MRRRLGPVRDNPDESRVRTANIGLRMSLYPRCPEQHRPSSRADTWLRLAGRRGGEIRRATMAYDAQMIAAPWLVSISQATHQFFAHYYGLESSTQRCQAWYCQSLSPVLQTHDVHDSAASLKVYTTFIRFAALQTFTVSTSY